MAKARRTKKKAEDSPGKTRKQRISDLLLKLEGRLGEDTKATLSDFIRLTQLERELEENEMPREIKITWIERTERSDTGK